MDDNILKILVPKLLHRDFDEELDCVFIEHVSEFSILGKLLRVKKQLKTYTPTFISNSTSNDEDNTFKIFSGWQFAEDD